MKTESETTKDAAESAVDAVVMPLWKIHPYLFSNGKFYVKSDVGDIEQILGTELNQHDDGTWHYHIEGDTTMFPVENAKALIARPISDINEEELIRIKALEPDIHPYEKKDAIITLCGRTEIMRFKTAHYLLTIGVYPFDQSHFETGEVIAKEA